MPRGLTMGLALLTAMAGCAGRGSPGEDGDPVADVTSAITSGGGLSSAGLRLGVLTNSCGANQAQDFFQVSNTGTTAVKLSDLSIKIWVDDTSGSAVVPAVNTGGCVVGPGNPSCQHNVTGVTAHPTSFAPACGPDATHQANWEITFSTSDATSLAPGQTWTNLQSALHLASFGNFTPGTGKWFSGCLPGTQYAADPHFALYYQGNLVFSSGIAAPSCRGPRGRQQLSGHITPQISGAPFVRPVPASTPVAISVGLPGQNGSGLQTLAQQVADPTSTSYRQYITPAQFASTFGAPAGDYQAVTAWATSLGLTVKTFPNQMVTGVSGTADQIERALFVNLNYYARPDGSVFYAPDREPSLDVTAPVAHIGQLDNFFRSRPATGGGTGPGPNGSFQGTDFRNAYIPTCAPSFTGAGQRVGLVSEDGFSLADLNIYAASTGLTIPNIQTVIVNPNEFTICQPAADVGCVKGGICRPDPSCPSGSNCCPGEGTICAQACASDTGCTTTGSACPSSLGITENTREIAADLEMTMSMAPGLDGIVVYEGTDSNTLLSAIATTQPLCNQISTSWFIPLQGTVTQTLFNELIVQGQTFFEASADDGKLPDGLGLANSSGITQVGGTSLTVTPGTGTSPLTYGSEAGWLCSSGWIANGTAGGPAATPIPPYQMGIDMTLNEGSTTLRNAPDVAFPSDGVSAVVAGTTIDIGGTSLASPLWAGFMALVNQQSAMNKLQPVGFFNPVLYAIAKSPLYKTCFNDVKDGGRTCNDTCDLSCAQTGFPTVPGYDLVTGWGTPTCELVYQLGTKSPMVAVPTTTLDVKGAITLTTPDASGQPHTTVTQFEQPVDFTVRARTGGFDFFVSQDGINGDVGGFYDLDPNSVDLSAVNEGFHVNGVGAVIPNGRKIPANTSSTFNNSLAIPAEGITMSWTLTLTSSQP